MSLFPVVFTLENFWVHVSSMNGSNVASDIEASINQHLGIRTALEIPDIYLNNDYIRF